MATSPSPDRDSGSYISCVASYVRPYNPVGETSEENKWSGVTFSQYVPNFSITSSSTNVSKDDPAKCTKSESGILSSVTAMLEYSLRPESNDDIINPRSTEKTETETSLQSGDLLPLRKENSPASVIEEPKKVESKEAKPSSNFIDALKIDSKSSVNDPGIRKTYSSTSTSDDVDSDPKSSTADFTTQKESKAAMKPPKKMSFIKKTLCCALPRNNPPVDDSQNASTTAPSTPSYMQTDSNGFSVSGSSSLAASSTENTASAATTLENSSTPIASSSTAGRTSPVPVTAAVANIAAAAATTVASTSSSVATVASNAAAAASSVASRFEASTVASSAADAAAAATTVASSAAAAASTVASSAAAAATTVASSAAAVVIASPAVPLPAGEADVGVSLSAPTDASSALLANAPKPIAGSTIQQFISTPNNQTIPNNTWSTCPAESFSLRVGPNYNWNKKKAPSPEAFFELVGVDFYTAPEMTRNVGSLLQLPAEWTQPHPSLDPKTPPLFIVNIHVPDTLPPLSFFETTNGSGWSLVLFFRMTEAAALAMSGPAGSATGSLKLLQDYLQAAPELDSSPSSPWKGRFKFMLRCENIDKFNFPSLITGYNGKPMLIRDSGSLCRGPGYVEMDVNGYQFGAVAVRAMLSNVAKSPEMLLTFGFCIEARAEEEMPETILGAATLNYPRFHEAGPLPTRAAAAAAAAAATAATGQQR